MVPNNDVNDHENLLNELNKYLLVFQESFNLLNNNSLKLVRQLTRNLSYLQDVDECYSANSDEYLTANSTLSIIFKEN